MSLPELVIYGRDGCGMCRHLKTQCDKEGVQYEFRSCDTEQGNQEMWAKASSTEWYKSSGGSVGLPVVDVYGECMMRPSIEQIKKRAKAAGLTPRRSNLHPLEAVGMELFKSMDANGDGQLSFEEVQGYLSDEGKTAEEIERMFLALDTDGDSNITLKEFAAGYSNFMLELRSTRHGCDTIITDCLSALNQARTDPSGYAQTLKEKLQYFNGTKYKEPGQQVTLLTNEGAAAVEEAIRELESQKPLKPLSLSNGLSHAAMDLLLDHGSKGLTGHQGSDGSRPSDRMSRHGEWQSTCGENCAYGGQTGKAHVDQLIIDDGVSSRGHRKNIYNPNFNLVGIAIGPHKGYGTACIQDFAGGYIEKRKSMPSSLPAASDGNSNAERGAAATRIQTKHRANAAKRLVTDIKDDVKAIASKALSQDGLKVYEASGALSPEMTDAIKDLPDQFVSKIKEGLANGNQVRVTVGTTQVGNGTQTEIKTKVWGGGCTMNMTFTMTRGA